VSAAANNPIIIRIGTNATGGTNRITNPTAGSYELYITAGTVDTGRTRVAIIDNVLVEAIVNTSFTFTITGVATSTVVNSETTTGSTTPTSIDYGTLSAGSAEVLAQRLNVTTNANNGFVVTVESDSGFQSANGADIDIFDDGVDTANPAVWNAPSTVVSQENTWGHWGVTSSDSDLNSLGGFYTGEFDANEFIAVSSTSPRQVFHHDGPSNGIQNNTGSTTVAYKVAISALQEAADDYNTTLTYIATPTF
nr:hypothetical protein [Candidatus Paceibacterota bacterium]